MVTFKDKSTNKQNYFNLWMVNSCQENHKALRKEDYFFTTNQNNKNVLHEKLHHVFNLLRPLKLITRAHTHKN